jgi:hypothetical protein
MTEFENAAKQLSSKQQQEAMRILLESADDPEAGIIRQKLAEPDKPLSQKQQFVFDTKILPAMVEHCVNHATCKGFTLPGGEYCDPCAVRLG